MKNLFTVVVILCLTTSAAYASSGAGAINMSFNTSVRANGMGEAGVAVTGGMDTNHWANPALLAFRPGLHYLSYETQLAVGFMDDIFLTNEELTFGAYGVTFLLATGPVKGNHLDMGTQMGTDENGQPIGEFDTYLESKSWGLGVDGVEVLEKVLGKEPRSWSKYASLAGGMTWHDFKGKMGPDSSIQDGTGGSAESNSKSMGYVLRVTPLEMTEGEGFLDNGIIGLRVGGAYGASIINQSDEYIIYYDADQSDPHPTAYHSGWSLDFEITLSDNQRQAINDVGFGFLGDMINPLISYSRAEQLSEPGFIWTGDEYEYEHDTSGERDEKSRGWEFGLANIFFIRGGNFSAPYGDIEDSTEGGGWKIQAGRLGGFRKDWADFPQATGLPTTRRTSWSVWVDPLAIADTFF